MAIFQCKGHAVYVDLNFFFFFFFGFLYNFISDTVNDCIYYIIYKYNQNGTIISLFFFLKELHIYYKKQQSNMRASLSKK